MQCLTAKRDKLHHVNNLLPITDDGMDVSFIAEFLTDYLQDRLSR